MAQEQVTIAVLALVGLLIGLIVFVSQPAELAAARMNPLGILAFCSLGASVGCLLADQELSDRWW
jgi:hypothetical protein